MLENEWQKESKREYKDNNGERTTTTLKYKIPFSNHFYYRHVVDDHNGIRHMVPSFEQTWKTHRWACRVFSFILAVTEVNYYLAFKYCVNDDAKGVKKMDFMSFRSNLAWALINNDLNNKKKGASARKKKRKRESGHGLETAPPHAKRWTGSNWDRTCKQKYQQHVCRGNDCNAKIRTYCVCSPGIWLCSSCLVNHVIDSDKIDLTTY